MQSALLSKAHGRGSYVNRFGRVDLENYSQQKKQKVRIQSQTIGNIINDCLQEESINTHDGPPKVRTRSTKRHAIQYRDSDGVLKDMTPQLSLWYLLYVQSPRVESKRFHAKFRLRFRLPYDNFRELVSWQKESHHFQRWMGKDCFGNNSSPLELLTLGSLRYLGRGWTFDDLYEATCIHEETHRQFFHVFIEWGRTDLFDRFVIAPTTTEEAKKHMVLFAKAGMNGAVASTDGTHIGMEQCSHYLSQAHTAAKLPMPARSYNLSSNHSRRILSTTTGLPAKFNDKTLQLFDTLLKDMYQGKKLQDVSFKLYERDQNNEVMKATYKGVWFLCDNGYINWSTMIPPIKQPLTIVETRWSKWVESMRKDVECTFGIMKGRFRVLKTGIRLHSVRSCDSIWMTCCALHNYLLEIDGLEEGWEDGVPSIWEGEAGLHDGGDRFLHPLMANEDYIQPSDFREYDASAMGHGNDVARHGDVPDAEQPENDDDENNNAIADQGKTYPKGATATRIVRELSFNYFQQRLIEHFDIMYEKEEVVWPQRKKKSQTTAV